MTDGCLSSCSEEFRSEGIQGLTYFSADKHGLRRTPLDICNFNLLLKKATAVAETFNITFLASVNFLIFYIVKVRVFFFGQRFLIILPLTVIPYKKIQSKRADPP